MADKKWEPWLQVIFRLSDGTELDLPFYIVGIYRVWGGNTISKPDVLGSRQPGFRTGTKAQTHSVTALAYGWGSAVGGYRDIIQRADRDSGSMVALVFPTERRVEAPLLIETWSVEELEYGLGTGEPTRARVNLELTST